jgi:hypothetical protein
MLIRWLFPVPFILAIVAGLWARQRNYKGLREAMLDDGFNEREIKLGLWLMSRSKEEQLTDHCYLAVRRAAFASISNPVERKLVLADWRKRTSVGRYLT